MASCYADPSLAERELSWKAEYGLERMCEWKTGHFNSVVAMNSCYFSVGYKPSIMGTESLLSVLSDNTGVDLWRWQSQNPTGFSNGTAP